MTLIQFKKDCGIGTKKSDFEGYSYMCILNQFRDNALSGFEQGYITAKQRDSLIEQGRNMANRFKY